MTTKQSQLPRWRGFNLLEFFTTQSSGEIAEDDLRWIRDWGFDFIRIPACYTLWIENEDPFALYEPMLEKIDRLIELAGRYGLHVSFNFHRAPGYSVNRERDEPFDLWSDQSALDAFCFHWSAFASRYKGVDSSKLSFDLVNEPPSPSGEDGAPVDRPNSVSREDHARVARAAINAIREIDPDRTIIADGLGYGNIPMPELADTGIAQSCRAYSPMGVSHYKATWVGGESWPRPTWPGGLQFGEPWDRARLEAHYADWITLAESGVGVHCGESGFYNFTPHEVGIHWYQDVLEILTEANIGFALWNFRGAFGILDSERTDVQYEDWHGHKLDRTYLELLQRF